MREFNKEEINPEDYWPEAGKMLDGHFAQKRRKRYMLLFSLLTVTTLGIVFFVNHSSAPLDKNPSPTPVAQAEEHTTANNTAVFSGNDNNLPSSGNDTENNTVTKTNVQHALRHPHDQTGVRVFAKSERAVMSTPADEVRSAAAQVTALSEETILSNTAVSEISKLQWMHLQPTGFIPPDSISELFHTEIRQRNLKQRTRWDILFYAGAGIISKELNAAPKTVYLDRRSEEEQPAFLPYGGLQMSKSVRNWDFRGGLEFSVMGEQVRYSPYSNGEYYNSYKDWEPYSYTVSDTDSTYIYGILFLNTRLETVNDSVYVTKTDTLNGTHYDPSVNAMNGTNRWYIVEVPLEVVYQVKRGRWGAGISAGIAPGVVVQSSGRYLNNDESGVTEYKNENTGSFTLNARAGLEFSYLMNANCRILLRPSGKYFLTQLEAGGGVKQRYSALGVNAGLLFTLP